MSTPTTAPAAAQSTRPSEGLRSVTGTAVLREAIAETARGLEVGAREATERQGQAGVRGVRPSALMSYRGLERPAVRLSADRGGLAGVRGLLVERQGWDELTRANPEAELAEIVIADQAAWERQQLSFEGSRDEMMLTLRRTRVEQGDRGVELALHLGLSDASSYLAASRQWSEMGPEESYTLGWGVLTGARIAHEGVELPGLPAHLAHGLGVDTLLVSANGDLLLTRREDPLARGGVALAPTVSGWARLADVQGASWDPARTLDRLGESSGVGRLSGSVVWAGLHAHLHDGSASLTGVVHSALTTEEICGRWEGEELEVVRFDPRGLRNLLVHWREDWMAWTIPALVDAANVSFGHTGAAAVGWAAHERELGQQWSQAEELTGAALSE